MATCTATADDRRTNDVTTEEELVGNLYVSEVEMAGWGATWQPDAPAARSWSEIEPHPPDGESRPPFEERDGRPIFKRLDAYGEDVLRLRRCMIGF